MHLEARSSRVARAAFQGLVVALLVATPAVPGEFGDERALLYHIDQNQAGAGLIDVPTLIEAGRRLFSLRFTSADGLGRPAASGAGLPARRGQGGQAFLRTNGPDSGSCTACHNQPEAGGAGDFSAVAFVLTELIKTDVLAITPELGNERGPPELHGSGLIELLAREMTYDLLEIRAAAIAQAASSGTPVRLELVTKGVDFGAITALPDGNTEAAEIEGVAEDLVIRPWSLKGTAVSLREFTITAENRHHGMQASERFGLSRSGFHDYDKDGVVDELTPGDITSLVLYQASLPPPRQVVPNNDALAAAVQRGEGIFEDIGCAACHRTEMVLNGLVFTEPGPFADEGTLAARHVDMPVAMDLGKMDWAADLERTPEGGVILRTFTDLKRHDIADEETPFFDNEVLLQGFRLLDAWRARGDFSPRPKAVDKQLEDALAAWHAGDDATAAQMWETLAEQGYSEAQCNLGVMYASGRGVSQDQGKAVRWFKLAANQDYPVAQYHLGLSYADGAGVQIDYAQAVKWFELASGQGYVPAQLYLGNMYALGRGIGQDAVKAYAWFSIAANQPNNMVSESALRNLQISASTLSPEQIARAEIVAAEYWKRYVDVENAPQDYVASDVFLTRRLWGAGNTGPYGHRGDLSTLNEAILMHGGEARQQRIAYQALEEPDRAAVIEYLLSWRVIPSEVVPVDGDPRTDPFNQRLMALWQAAQPSP